MGDWLDGGGSGSPCDARALLDSGASDLICSVVEAGALVSLGLTSDGGALGVTVTVDGRWRREYFRDSESMMLWLSDGLPDIQAAAGDRRASSVQRQRQRSRRGA
jgi:hypothetical protein